MFPALGKEPSSCFPRVMNAFMTSDFFWLKLYESPNMVGEPLIKMENKVLLKKGELYEEHYLTNNGRLTENIKKNFEFIGTSPIKSDVLIYYCPTERPNEYYVEYLNNRLYFKLDKTLDDYGRYDGSAFYEDLNTIRSLILKNKKYQTALDEFINCLEKYGESCNRKEHENTAKVMFYAVDVYSNKDCNMEMPKISKFDVNKQYKALKSSVENTIGIMRMNKEYLASYSLELKNVESFRYSIVMFNSVEHKCKDWLLDKVIVKYKIGEDGKGYFDYSFNSQSY